MPVLNVNITARAPLVFSERRPDGQFRQSTRYVPGAVIRGALAQQLLDAGEHSKEHPGEEFTALFMADDAPLFRNAYPALDAQGSGLSGSRPLPATAYGCKAEGGFAKHGVFDSLIDRLCREELKSRIPYLPRCMNSEHKEEDETEGANRVEARDGFYLDTPGGRSDVKVPLQLTGRTALNRRRKVSEEGLLYSPFVIAEASRSNGTATAFRGSVVVNEKTRELVTRRLSQLTHIGSGVARGFGRVDVNVEGEADDDLAGRVQQFNELAVERRKLWSRLPHDEQTRSDEGVTYFTVMLVSEAVLREDGWTPTVRLEPLQFFSDDVLRKARLLRCYAGVEYRGGWNTAWGLPKDTEPVARMGSVYVYSTARTRADAGLLKGLRELEEQGVGERRAEGFGQVRVCDEFHLATQEVK